MSVSFDTFSLMARESSCSVLERSLENCLARFTRLSVLLVQQHLLHLLLSLFSSSPLHGHVDDVQREVARKCGLAHLLLFRHCCILWLMPCSVKSPRPRFQVLYSSSYSSLLSSQGGGTSSFRAELSHLTTSSGIRSRCDPRVSGNDFLSLPSSHFNPPAHISSCSRCPRHLSVSTSISRGTTDSVSHLY